MRIRSFKAGTYCCRHWKQKLRVQNPAAPVTSPELLSAAALSTLTRSNSFMHHIIFIVSALLLKGLLPCFLHRFFSWLLLSTLQQTPNVVVQNSALRALSCTHQSPWPFSDSVKPFSHLPDVRDLPLHYEIRSPCSTHERGHEQAERSRKRSHC